MGYGIALRRGRGCLPAVAVFVYTTCGAAANSRIGGQHGVIGGQRPVGSFRCLHWFVEQGRFIVFFYLVYLYQELVG